MFIMIILWYRVLIKLSDVSGGSDRDDDGGGTYGGGSGGVNIGFGDGVGYSSADNGGGEGGGWRCWWPRSMWCVLLTSFTRVTYFDQLSNLNLSLPILTHMYTFFFVPTNSNLYKSQPDFPN